MRRLAETALSTARDRALAGVLFAKRLFALLTLLLTGLPTTSAGNDFSSNPNRSLLVNVSLGVALDTSREARSPANYNGEHVEAYSAAAFLIGLGAGYRFNEILGIEAGWHDQQHQAHPEWGGRAHYIVGHTALRLAWPLESRFTPVLTLGPAVGQFSYGSATFGEAEDNDSLVVGGLVGLTLEYEITLGLVTTLEVFYLPLCRFGMGGELVLEESDYDVSDAPTTVLYTKDFTHDQFVNALWISLGIQFEWTFL